MNIFKYISLFLRVTNYIYMSEFVNIIIYLQEYSAELWSLFWKSKILINVNMFTCGHDHKAK